MDRPIGEITWCKWYYWLISHITESVKKSASGVKEKIMKLSEAKVDSNIPNEPKPKNCRFFG